MWNGNRSRGRRGYQLPQPYRGRIQDPVPGNPYAQTTFRNVKAFSVAFLPRQPQNANEGGKIILHSSVLEQLTVRFQHNMPHPMLFEVKNPKTNRISHCGVLEFTAPDRSAYMPLWMMQNLELQDGDNVEFRLVALPKVRKITIQPLRYTFAKINNPKAELESCLVNFPAITQGDTFMVNIGGEEHYLRAVEVGTERKDKTAGCLIDTQVEVEFMEPIEAAPEEEKVRELTEGIPMEDQLNADEFRYFLFRMDRENPKNVIFKVKSISGDPDVYVSTAINNPRLENYQWTTEQIGDKELKITPKDRIGTSGNILYIGIHAYKEPSAFSLSVLQEMPSPSELDSRSFPAQQQDEEKQSHSSSSSSATSSSSPSSAGGGLLGFGSFSDDSTENQRRRKMIPSFLSSQQQKSGRAQPSSSSSSRTTGKMMDDESFPRRQQHNQASGQSISTSSPSPGAAADDGIVCDNCWRKIPKPQFQMHSLRCGRQNWYCVKCEKAIPRTEKDKHSHCDECNKIMDPELLPKHKDRMHRKRQCDCGEFFEPKVLEFHKLDFCPFRPVPCKFCKADVKAMERQEHEKYCGSKSINCPTCGESVPRRTLDNHNAVKHGINPSLPGAEDVLETGMASSGGVSGGFQNPSAQSELDMQRALLASQREAAKTEDDILAAVIAESMKTASGGGEMAKDDFPASASSSSSSYPSSNVRRVENIYEKPSSSSSAAAQAEVYDLTTTPYVCFYCHNDFPSERILEDHMEICEAADQMQDDDWEDE